MDEKKLQKLETAPLGALVTLAGVVSRPKGFIGNRLREYIGSNSFFRMNNSDQYWAPNITPLYDTPIGLYCYPLNVEFFYKFLDGELPFQQNARYIWVYKLNVPEKLLTVSKYTKEMLISDIDKIADIDAVYVEEKVLGRGRAGSFVSDLLYFLYKIRRFTKYSVSKQLLDLGYCGIYDDSGSGTIHTNEPTQAVFFSSKFLDVVEIMPNDGNVHSVIPVDIKNRQYISEDVAYNYVFDSDPRKAAQAVFFAWDLLTKNDLKRLMEAQDPMMISVLLRKLPKQNLKAYIGRKMFSQSMLPYHWELVKTRKNDDEGTALPGRNPAGVFELANNANTTKEIAKLLTLENPEINKALLGNPSVPDDIKQKIKQEQYSEKYDYLAASQTNTVIKESILDIQELRHAALELQGNSQDIVKVAGIIKRIKNWWKARFNPEFAKQTAIVEEAIGDTKGPLSQLISELKEFDTAIQNHDPDTVAQLVGTIPGTIAQVTKDMSVLQQKLKAADMVIPTTYVDQDGKEIAAENLSWVQKGYKKDRALMEKLWEALPEKFRDEIPVGKAINKPLSSFAWYQDYTPEDISISQTVYTNLKASLMGGTKSLKIKKQIAQGFDEFINNLKRTIFENGVLMNVRFPAVSEQVGHRPSNQMVLDIKVGDVPFPFGDTELFFSVPKVTLNDLGTGIYHTKKLTVYGIWKPTLSPASYQIIEQIKAQSKQEPPDFEQVQSDEALLIDPESIVEGSGPVTGMVKFALDSIAFSVSQEVADICKDLRELGDEDLLHKGMCAYAAMTDVEKPNVDLSYSYLMRKLRKGDDDKRIKFQKAFKDAFDKALYEDLDEPSEVALVAALKEIS